MNLLFAKTTDSKESRMDVHQNARLTPRCRELLVGRVLAGRRPRVVGRELGISVKTVHKWVKRFEVEGIAGLRDRSSRPRHSPHATVEPLRVAVVALRRQRLTLTAIATQLGLSRSSVARICREGGLSRLSQLEPTAHYPRYERAQPGELLHLDVKKLGRIVKVGHRITGDPRDQTDGAGWEYVHVAIDDHSRVGYCQMFPDEEAISACMFLRAAVAYYAGLGVTLRAVLTDNGGCYRSKDFAGTCAELGLRHQRTRPYTPRTNGKAERFIQSALREWAYARAYRTSAQRINALPRWLHGYNWHRPHASLAGQPPTSRLNLDRNNLLRLHS
jgi:transposase InsO family protein